MTIAVDDKTHLYATRKRARSIKRRSYEYTKKNILQSILIANALLTASWA